MTWKSSPLASGTLGSQAAANGIDEYVLAGTAYVGNLIVIRRNNADEEYAVVSSSEGSNVYKVDRDWVNPPVSGDTYAIGHTAADGFDAGDFDRVSNTQEWYVLKAQVAMTGTFLVGFVNGVQLDTTDQAQSATDGPFTLASGVGMYCIGAQINTRTGGSGATDGNQMIDNSAGTGRLVMDNTSVNSVQSSKIECDSTTSKAVFVDYFNYKAVHSNLFHGECFMRRATWQGTGLTTQWHEIAEAADIDGATLKDMYGWRSRNNAAAETIVVNGYTSVGAGRDVEVFNQKTWEFFDVKWPRLLTFTGTTNSRVREGDRLFLTVTDPAGTAISAARSYVYEGVINSDLPTRNRQSTDASGLASSGIVTRETISASNTQFGNHVLKIYKHQRNPFVLALATTTGESAGLSIVQPVALSIDSNVVQATAATAITAGSGISVTKGTNPNSTIDFTGGAGTLTGTITGSPSGASGTFRELFSGSAVAGKMFLHTRNTTAFANGDSLSNGAGWTGTYTASTEDRFAWEWQASALTAQINYDYQHARLDEASITNEFRDVIIWGEAEHALMFQADGANWKTERNVANTEGVYVSNLGVGTVSYFTADDGTQIIPPATVDLTISGVTWGTSCTIVARETAGGVSDGDVLLQAFADSAGQVTTSFVYTGDVDVAVSARNQGIAVAAIADDNGSFTDETVEASNPSTNDMNLLPTTPVVNQDAYLFGHNEQFAGVKVDVATAGTGGFTITWQYWNGASWAALTGVIDSTVNYSVLGNNKITWTIPGDWATTTVNGQGPLYYVRSRYTGGTVTVTPLGKKANLDVTRYLPFDVNRTIGSGGLPVTATWAEDTISRF